MYVSAHTIAFHLRQVFRKLNIGSRVELARIVLEQTQQSESGLTTPLTGTPACASRPGWPSPRSAAGRTVNKRWMKTAAVASASGMPAAVRPRIRPASTTPMPPGVGETPPIVAASVMTTMRMGSRRWSSNARSDTDRAIATTSSCANDPLTRSTSFRGWLATSCRLPQMSRTFGRSVSAARRRSRGTARARPATRPTSTTTARMIHTSAESSPDWGVTSRSRDPQANGSATRNSTLLAIQLDEVMMAPELSATVAS